MLLYCEAPQVGFLTYISQQGVAWFFAGVQPPPFETVGKDVSHQPGQRKAKAHSSFPTARVLPYQWLTLTPERSVACHLAQAFQEIQESQKTALPISVPFP